MKIDERAAELLRWWEQWGAPRCPAVIDAERKMSPEYYVSPQNQHRHVVLLRLRNNPKEDELDSIEGLCRLEEDYQANRMALAERAEELIDGKTFVDDETTRWSKSWCRLVIEERHGRHRETWAKHGAQVVALLEGSIDPQEIMKNEHARLARGEFS